MARTGSSGIVRIGAVVIALTALVSCGQRQDSLAEPDLGPIEDVLDDLTKTTWPGVIDADGERFIRLINGFFDDGPTAYWFSGFAPRFTADAFWFCREGDQMCPLDANGNVNGSAMVGRPVFTRIPGEAGYSPYWVINVVRVALDYERNALKSTLGIERAAADGLIRIESFVYDHATTETPAAVIVHCLVVLRGTGLERNGMELVGQPGQPSQRMDASLGWHKQFSVELYDFTATEGVFAPDPESTDRALMPAANIFVLGRDCAGGSQSPVCDHSSAAAPSVSERGVEADLTGDGDKSDTNNIVAAFPGIEPRDPADRPYSALWAVNVVGVPAAADADLSLIDTTGDQLQSDARSVKAMRALVLEERLNEPEPMSEAQAGNQVPGNDGKVFFNCPAQVPAL